MNATLRRHPVARAGGVDKCLHSRYGQTMALYMVSYDLRQPGRNYGPVYKLLALWGASRLLESLWLVASALPVTTLRDQLRQYVDANDGVAVIELSAGSSWATSNVQPAGSRWLQLNIP